MTEEGIRPLATLPEDLLDDYAYISFTCINYDTTKDMEIGIGGWTYTHREGGGPVTYYFWYSPSIKPNVYTIKSDSSDKSDWYAFNIYTFTLGAVPFSTCSDNFMFYNFVSSIPLDVLFEDVDSGVVGEGYTLTPEEGTYSAGINLPRTLEYTGLPFHGVLQCTEGVGETSYVPTSSDRLDVPLVLDAEYDSGGYYGEGTGKVWYI